MVKSIEYRFYKLVFPVEFTLEQSIDFFDTVTASLKRNRLGGSAETMVLELWSNKTGITHRIGIPWQRAELVDQLRGHLPGIYIEEHKRESIPDWTHVVELGVNDGTRPFNLVRVHAQAKRILSAAGTTEMKPDDTIVMQWVVAAADRIAPPSSSNPPQSSSWSALWRGRTADSQELAERRENATHSQFRGVLRLAASSSTDAHAKKLVSNLKKALKAPETAAVHFTDQWWTLPSRRIERLNRGLPLNAPVHFINATELAAFSWPIGVSSFPGLSMGRTRYLPPNEAIVRDGRRLGLSYEKRPVAISPVDACRHMYVVGPSGLGKTTLLTNSIQQDMERGDGVVVIESKGDLFRAGLNAVPPERLGDVVVMDFTDHEWAVGLNILRGGNINSRVDDLTRLFARGDGDIYFRDLMYHGLHTLAHFPELTIVDLVPFIWPQNNAMLKAWRDGLIDQLPKNDVLYQYWKSFVSMKDSEQKQRVQPVLNRLWEVTSRPDIKRILGQSESTINLREVMRDNKLLFIYVPDSLGEAAVSQITSLLFKEMWDAVRDVEKNRPTFLYLDEMQRLAGHVDLGEVLSLARSFKFGLVMAHQHRGQLTKDLESSITNAATKVAFRLEGPDANWMQSIMGKAVTAQDFMSLDKYEVIAQVGTSGGSSAPTWFKTLPQFEPHGRASEAVAYSRKRYSRPATEVDQSILRRRAAPAKSETKRARTFGDSRKQAGDE